MMVVMVGFVSILLTDKGLGSFICLEEEVSAGSTCEINSRKHIHENWNVIRHLFSKLQSALDFAEEKRQSN